MMALPTKRPSSWGALALFSRSASGLSGCGITSSEKRALSLNTFMKSIAFAWNGVARLPVRITDYYARQNRSWGMLTAAAQFGGYRQERAPNPDRAALHKWVEVFRPEKTCHTDA